VEVVLFPFLVLVVHEEVVVEEVQLVPKSFWTSFGKFVADLLFPFQA